MLINLTLDSTTSLWNSVREYGGPQVKRFVLLSSTASIQNSLEDTSQTLDPYSEKDWSLVTQSHHLIFSDANQEPGHIRNGC